IWEEIMAQEKHTFTYLDEYLIREYFGLKLNKEHLHPTYPMKLKVDTKEIVIQAEAKGGERTIHVENDTADSLLKKLRELDDTIKENQLEIFVVCGRGNNGSERDELEELLEKWNCKPIYLDKQKNGGATLIEKLESNINSREVGIVLATPDDIGYHDSVEGRLSPKYRLRQNVLLELGWLIGKFGRQNIILLQRNHRDYPIEIASDIYGVVYVDFKDSVNEIQTKQALAKELFPILVGKDSHLKGNKYLVIGD
ncbi:TPA: TIR domain-containing protein, partial [Streptococcus suis]